jgi:hypothetical protein
MSTMNRREVLQSLLHGALQATGAVVLASSALPAAARQPDAAAADGDLLERADRLASGEGLAGEHQFCAAWVNGGFRRGGFANGGFRNGGGGAAFRNGGGGGAAFRNGGGGGAAFRNGGGGFGNGGFRNGGGAFRNSAFRNF